MADFDIEARADAIAELAPISQGGSGQVITLTTPQASEIDPKTDRPADVPPLVETGSGVEEDYSAYAIDGAKVLAGDTKLMLSPVTLAGADITKPVPESTVLTMADGSKRSVVRVGALAPAGRVVMFNLQLRGVA